MNVKPKQNQFATVSVDAKLVRAARDLGIDVEAEVESALKQKTQKKRTHRVPKHIIDSHNRFIETYGSLSDDFENI
jgi:post-segregation antitoxin (ccd killing protein)